jgi:predicted sugar kinase
VLRRHPLSHTGDAAAWAWVLFLPRVGSGLPDTLEAERLAGLLAAGPHLSAETGRLLEAELWPALRGDDIEAFGRALRAIQDLNAAALERVGTAVPLTSDEQAILDIYRDSGAVAWGRSPNGLSLFALIRGAVPSVAMRRQVVARVGIQGGTALAAIVDNEGARHAIQAAAPIYTGASPLVAGSQVRSSSNSAANGAAGDEERR